MRFTIVTLCFLFISVGAWADIEMKPFEYLNVQMGDSRSKVMSVVEKSGARDIVYSAAKHTIMCMAAYGIINQSSYVYYFNEQDRLIAVVVYIPAAVVCEDRFHTPGVIHPDDYPKHAFIEAADKVMRIYELDGVVTPKYDSCGDWYQTFKIDTKRIIRISMRCKILHIQYSNEGVVE